MVTRPRHTGGRRSDNHKQLTRRKHLSWLWNRAILLLLGVGLLSSLFLVWYFVISSVILSGDGGSFSTDRERRQRQQNAFSSTCRFLPQRSSSRSSIPTRDLRRGIRSWPKLSHMKNLLRDDRLPSKPKMKVAVVIFLDPQEQLQDTETNHLFKSIEVELEDYLTKVGKEAVTFSNWQWDVIRTPGGLLQAKGSSINMQESPDRHMNQNDDNLKRLAQADLVLFLISMELHSIPLVLKTTASTSSSMTSTSTMTLDREREIRSLLQPRLRQVLLEEPAKMLLLVDIEEGDTPWHGWSTTQALQPLADWYQVALLSIPAGRIPSRWHHPQTQVLKEGQQLTTSSYAIKLRLALELLDFAWGEFVVETCEAWSMAEDMAGQSSQWLKDGVWDRVEYTVPPALDFTTSWSTISKDWKSVSVKLPSEPQRNRT